MTAPRWRHQWRRAGHTFKHQMTICRRNWRVFLVHGRVIAYLRSCFLHGVLQYGCEDCQVCGRSYVLWHADDEVWLAVVGKSSGCLCPNCFDLKAQDAGYPTLMWRPVPEKWEWPTYNKADNSINWPRLSRPETEPA